MRKFTIKPTIDYNTFRENGEFEFMLPKKEIKAKKRFLKFLVKKYSHNKEYSISELETNAHLVNTYHVSNNIINSFGTRSTVSSIYSRILIYLNTYLMTYLSTRSLIERGCVIPKVSVFGMSPFWINVNGELCVRKKYIQLLTSDEKRVISGIYGEALVRLILETSPKLPSAGVLKINSSKDSTPDYLVITKDLRIAMVAEVKSSINTGNKDSKRQIVDFKNKYPREKIRGIGINVNLNYKHNTETPIEIKVKDPEFTFEGDIVPSILWRLALIESVVKVRKQILVEPVDLDWANGVVGYYNDMIKEKGVVLEKIKKYRIKDNKLQFENRDFEEIVRRLLFPKVPRNSENNFKSPGLKDRNTRSYKKAIKNGKVEESNNEKGEQRSQLNAIFRLKSVTDLE